MFDGIVSVLEENGYREMLPTGEVNGYRVFYYSFYSVVNAVMFVDASEYKEDFVKSFKEGLKKAMDEKGVSAHFFMVMLVNSKKDKYLEEMTVAKQVNGDDALSWTYDEGEKKLYIYENQMEDFYGLKGILEKAALVSEKAEPKENVSNPTTVRPSIKDELLSFPKVTIGLLLVNVAVFIICTFTGDLLYNKGGLGLSLISSPIDYYRLISSMFLHADVAHIFNNMLLLYAVGEVVEKRVGPLSFALMYFFSGIIGGITTFVYEIFSGNRVVVIGASGAIFGLLGGLFALVLFKFIRRKTMPLSRVFVVILLSIYSGFTGLNTANWAHIGGLVGGFLFGVVYCLIMKNTKAGENQNED